MATTILMYHAIGDEHEAPGRFVVPRRRFERQLAWLALTRRRVIGLEDVARALDAGAAPPPRSVVLTFDDGYRDNARLALPALRARGFPATVFVVSDRVGEANGWDGAGAALHGRTLLSREELRALHAAGIAIGAHTRTHRPLPGLPLAEVREEVRGSKERLEEELGAPVSTFAYPHGKVDGRAEAVVRDSGFLLACGVLAGRTRAGAPRYRLPRLTVDGRASLLRFALLLTIGTAYPERATLHVLRDVAGRLAGRRPR